VANDRRIDQSGLGSERTCVYTALLGDYETLTEQPVAAASGIDFICLSDNPALESETWEIRHVQPLFARDATRSQRWLKIRAHASVAAYDRSLYIDNSVLLTRPPEDLFEELLPAATPFAAMAHGFRESVAAEFDEVVRLGLDTRIRCAEQQRHYELEDPDGLRLRPLKGCLLLRRHHDPLVVAAMETWALHVLRYSRRDQLSLWFCLRQVELEPLVHALDNFASPYHRWPVSEGRTPVDQPWSDDDLAAATVRVSELEEELVALRGSRTWRWAQTARRATRFPKLLSPE